jgi:hypothetical protein
MPNINDNPSLGLEEEPFEKAEFGMRKEVAAFPWDARESQTICQRIAGNQGKTA